MVDPIRALPDEIASLGVAALAIAVAVILHWTGTRIALRLVRRSTSPLDDAVVQRLQRPMLWLFIVVALSSVEPALNLSQKAAHVWVRVAGLAVPAVLGWLVIAAVGSVADLVKASADISAQDNLRARQRRTRVDILNRIAVFVVLLATFCFMLMSIPSVRNIGVTLIASAGLAALAVGAAAQPALKNLIGGLQMVFTEPIRIDDVVIIDGEWGRIEEIRLTYVVVKVWDERRLIVPVSRFLEDTFQNWTRETSALMGSVIWHFDPAADVPRLREKLHELVEAHPKWDGRFCNLQVTDTRPDSIEVRALMTARDASIAFDLRCDIREAMLDHVRSTMPEALVRHRTRLESGSEPLVTG